MYFDGHIDSADLAGMNFLEAAAAIAKRVVDDADKTTRLYSSETIFRTSRRARQETNTAVIAAMQPQIFDEIFDKMIQQRLARH
jgi:hypothetical protein